MVTAGGGDSPRISSRLPEDADRLWPGRLANLLSLGLLDETQAPTLLGRPLRSLKIVQPNARRPFQGRDAYY